MDRNDGLFEESRRITECRNDRLFEEAKLTNKKIVPFGSKLTIMGSREYFQCIVEGRKICQKNQGIVDQAIANNQRVRSNYGRYLTIVGTKEYFDRKKTNLANVLGFRNFNNQ